MSRKEKIILPLFDGGVTSVDYKTDDFPGCETCDYGSSYTDDFTVELTKYRMEVHIDNMYSHFISEGWLMRQLLSADHGMTESQFVWWLKTVMDDYFRTNYGGCFDDLDEKKTDRMLTVTNKETGTAEVHAFPDFSEEEYLKKRRREQDEQ